jgi:hypothetical protein
MKYLFTTTNYYLLTIYSRITNKVKLPVYIITKLQPFTHNYLIKDQQYQLLAFLTHVQSFSALNVELFHVIQ